MTNYKKKNQKKIGKKKLYNERGTTRSKFVIISDKNKLNF